MEQCMEERRNQKRGVREKDIYDSPGGVDEFIKKGARLGDRHVEVLVELRIGSRR